MYFLWPNKKKVELRDKVVWRYSQDKYDDIGVVVAIIDERKAIESMDFDFLIKNGGGIIVIFPKVGMVQFARDDDLSDIEPV